VDKKNIEKGKKEGFSLSISAEINKRGTMTGGG